MNKKYTCQLVGSFVLCVLFVVICVSLVEALIRSDAEHEQALLHDNMLNTAVLIAQDIQRNISYANFATETLHALLDSSDYDLSLFDIWGRQLVSGDSPQASVVQLAPDGVLSYSYPLEGNEGAIGHDLLKDKRRDDGARLAIHSKELTFVGPVRLIQNGKYAVIARKPIFRIDAGKEYFWGFATALLHVEDILPDMVRHLGEDGLLIELEGSDPDKEGRPVLYTSGEWNVDDEISFPIKVPNGEWQLRLGHKPIHNQYYSMFRWAAAVLSVLAACYIFLQQYIMVRKQTEISSLNERLTELSLQDELTEAGNRRAAMQLLDELTEQSDQIGETFCVAMVDLDRFKDVNDQFGHPAGDMLLCHVAAGLCEFSEENCSLFRMGGDEFLMVFKGVSLSSSRENMKRIVGRIGKTDCTCHGNVLSAEMSVGVVERQLGESVEDLLQRADAKLYEAKKAKENVVV